MRLFIQKVSRYSHGQTKPLSIGDGLGEDLGFKAVFSQQNGAQQIAQQGQDGSKQKNEGETLGNDGL